jgi:DnaK suppressor protein
MNGILVRRATNTRELERYKQLLIAKRGELSPSRAADAPLVMGAGGPQGDLMDQANADTQAELWIQLKKSDAHLLQAIEDALARLRIKTFGICQICKRPISKGRLDAVPWTHACRECKEREQSVT